MFSTDYDKQLPAPFNGNSITWGQWGLKKGQIEKRFPSSLIFNLKVENPYSYALIIKSYVFEGYVLWCGSNNGYQMDMFFFQEIGLLAQNMAIIVTLRKLSIKHLIFH